MSMYTREGTPPDSEMKAACETEKTTSLNPSAATQLPVSTNCLACSEDGRYLGLGHALGLSVWSASSLLCAAEWKQDALEVTSIQMTAMGESAYMLGAVDDMGVARVFAYHREAIHPLSVINTMENINKRSICLTFELSEGGDYAAASISCNGAAWLEVFHLPSEAWLKEMETAQKQDPNSSEDVDMKWSPVAVVIKIKPPKNPAGPLDGPLELFRTTDWFSRLSAQEVDRDAGNTKEKSESPPRCTQHFLWPCGPFPGGSKAKPAGGPVAVSVWWSGSQNLLQYSLHKAPKNKTDVEPVPDVLWPNAKTILCSAVSRCSRFVALGLEGSPLSVVMVTAADSDFSRMQFVDNCPDIGPDHDADVSQTFPAATVCVLLLCKSGATHTVTAGRGTQTLQRSERPKEGGDIPAVAAPVAFLQSLSLVVQRNGEMFLQDIINRSRVCSLMLPTTHRTATPCVPVYALSTEQQTLYIRGDQDSGCAASSEAGSQLFIFRFGESDIIRRWIVSLPDSPRQLNTPSYETLEDSCNLYLQQRALSVDERNDALTQTWKQLQETAATLQQTRKNCSS
ncbi:WD repeat-containing protein 93 isoform X2 [Pseudoliparis swirei]|uniref:WD repeat-containing protein 93 isoform X2 n=1 Tax=Pseudoliparis swirei TaxID=2059687 RepID=UPI0024BDC550|nr:WD repeat-containing protein 93 isoform X2 [Pseudoliparis swirei]